MRMVCCCRPRRASQHTAQMNSSQKTLEILIETERIGDKILQNKQEIFALSKRRTDTREAIRKVEQSADDKTWLTVGSILVKVKKDKALELLRKGNDMRAHTAQGVFVCSNYACVCLCIDQNQINIELGKMQSDQKVLVSTHRDLEYSTPLKGFDLKPLSRTEVNVMRDNLPGF